MKKIKFLLIAFFLLSTIEGAFCGTNYPLSYSKTLPDSRMVGIWRLSSYKYIEILYDGTFNMYEYNHEKKVFDPNINMNFNWEDLPNNPGQFYYTSLIDGASGKKHIFISYNRTKWLNTGFEHIKIDFDEKNNLIEIEIPHYSLFRIVKNKEIDFGDYFNSLDFESPEQLQNIIKRNINNKELFAQPVIGSKVSLVPKTITDSEILGLGASKYSSCPAGRQYYLSGLLGLWEGEGDDYLYQFYLDKKEGRIREILYSKYNHEKKYKQVWDQPLNVSALNDKYYIYEDPNKKQYFYKIISNPGSVDKLYYTNPNVDLSLCNSTTEVRDKLYSYINKYETDLINGNRYPLHRVSEEVLKEKEKKDDNLGLALILLLGLAIFSGDGSSNPAPSNNSTWEARPSTPYGYDREGQPIYDKVSPLYYDQYGNKKW